MSADNNPSKMRWHASPLPRVGTRATRDGGKLSGTVVEVAGIQFKVKWDSGRTSYYSSDLPNKIHFNDT